MEGEEVVEEEKEEVVEDEGKADDEVEGDEARYAAASD